MNPLIIVAGLPDRTEPRRLIERSRGRLRTWRARARERRNLLIIPLGHETVSRALLRRRILLDRAAAK